MRVYVINQRKQPLMPTTPIFDLRTLEGAKIHASASYKKLKLLEKQKKTTLCERRMQEDC